MHARRTETPVPPRRDVGSAMKVCRLVLRRRPPLRGVRRTHAWNRYAAKWEPWFASDWFITGGGPPTQTRPLPPPLRVGRRTRW